MDDTQRRKERKKRKDSGSCQLLEAMPCRWSKKGSLVWCVLSKSRSADGMKRGETRQLLQTGGMQSGCRGRIAALVADLVMVQIKRDDVRLLDYLWRWIV
jgi:hypothetical protein